MLLRLQWQRYSRWLPARRAWQAARRPPLPFPRQHASSLGAPFWTRHLHTPPTKIALRPYQEECVQSVLTAFAEGRRQIGVSLATGAGKTVIFTEIIGRMEPPSSTATQTLILVHRQELVEQAAKHCSSRYPDKTVDIEMGNLHASGHADITVASVQSIISKDRIHKFDPSAFKLILVDEAHHIVAASYLRVLHHFGLQSEAPDPLTTPALVGVSATFGRHDGLAIGKAIKYIVFHKDYIDMIGEKWLSDVIFTTVDSKAKLSDVKVSKASGDFLPSSLSAAVNNDESNLITVRAWMHRAAGRKSTLAFCVDIAHLTSLTNTFRAHGIDARFVTGDTPRPVRSQRLDAFRRGEYPVLLNCGVFTEGTDIPNIDCVVLARPTKSRNLLVQMIGRGMRLHPGKANCHIIDMVGSLERGIVSTPSLFGLDPDALIENCTAADLQRKAAAHKENERRREAEEGLEASSADPSLATQALTRQIAYTDYDSVNDLVADTSGERHIRAVSSNAWINVGPARFVLNGDANQTYLMLERPVDDHLWRVRLHGRVPNPSEPGLDIRRRPVFMRPREVASAETFESAVKAADTCAAARFPQRLITLRRPAASWRDRPASQAQVDLLNKFRDADERLAVDDITRGEAGDALTKLKHGARGRFKEIEAAKRRRDATARKAQEERQREERAQVRVGPV